MEHAKFESIKQQLPAASAGQTLDLVDVLEGIISQRVAETALARRTRLTLKSRICPHCRSNDIKLHGRDQNGRQRYKCRDCRRTYNILTGTPMARARKPEKWGQYLACMTEHMPLRQIVASGIGVHLVTAWRWRHRFLKAAANDNTAVLSGVVEAAETSFRRSYKGTRGMKGSNPMTRRADSAREWGAADRMASHDQVPVLTALDSGGGVFEAILVPPQEIETALDGRVAAGSVLCCGADAPYAIVAERAGAEHYPVFNATAASNPTQINRDVMAEWATGRLGLRRVNSYHRTLKYLINGRCRGVATKYLWNYLGWHRAMNRPKFHGNMLLDRALE